LKSFGNGADNKEQTMATIPPVGPDRFEPQSPPETPPAAPEPMEPYPDEEQPLDPEPFQPNITPEEWPGEA
jgi:hypothetical protein